MQPRTTAAATQHAPASVLDAAPLEAAPSEPTSASHAPRLRIALAHDWLCGYRGGEAVLERIAAITARDHDITGLYVMFDDRRPLSVTVDAIRAQGLIVPSPLNLVSGSGARLRRWLLPLYPSAVASLSRRLRAHHATHPVDLVISTSSAAIKGLQPPPGALHLCYCHAPARYVWSRQQDYSGGLRGIGLGLMGARFRTWDARTASSVTHFLANSRHTATEIRRCYGRQASVVHPPVRTEFFTPEDSTTRHDFWLIASALEPYKRIDLAIRSAAHANAELIVAGAGSQRKALEQLARSTGAHVRFAGRVSDAELRELFRTARLMLFPQIEDFGIAAAEALACGLPVVARAAGGALDIVDDGTTGALFEDDTPEALARAAARAPQPPACTPACRASALRFSEAAFDAAFAAQLAALTPTGTTSVAHA